MKLMKKLIAIAMVAATVLAISVPASAATIKYVNVSPDVNMRQSSPTGSVIVRIPKGARVDVDSTFSYGGGTWSYVKFGSLVGYVDDQYLSTSGGVTYPGDVVQAFSNTTLQMSSKKLYMIKNIQLALNYGGYSAGTADGVFGGNTETAVKSFQAAKGLTVDGIVGSATKSALWTAYGSWLTSNGVMYITP